MEPYKFILTNWERR